MRTNVLPQKKKEKEKRERTNELTYYRTSFPRQIEGSVPKKEVFFNA
jgi:hypothetical protein